MYKGDFSKSDMAETILGLRDTRYMPIDQPAELGYHCPACEYEIIDGGNIDERLFWSEYNYCIWCSVCNADYPVVACAPPEKMLNRLLKIISDDRLRTKDSGDNSEN